VQNTFRLGQLFIILAGSAAMSLGAVQAALGGGVTELGVAEALLAGALTGAVTYIRGREAQPESFTSRLEAERLRGEYFLFLDRVAPYDSLDEQERLARLREQLARITTEGSP
jgi:membrane protein implicated in regulation of membrane protease activity